MTRMHAVKLLITRFVVFFSALFFSALCFSQYAASQNLIDDSETKNNLFVFVFKEGVAQPLIKVQAGEQTAITNEYGSAAFALPKGDYELGYFANDELFALTEVSLQETVSSQVFLSLSKSGTDVELDLPLSAYEQVFDQTDLKQQTGPKGTLKMRIVDSVSQKPVVGAKLFFRGYAVEGLSDDNGIALVELSEGEYDISVVHPKYVMQVSKDVKVSADKTTDTELKLIKADIVLDEFVVSAPFVEGSLASNIADLKNSDVIGDAISSEQFSKSGDSDAASALKRVTGITIVDDKYVYVRGLGERYSTVLVNNLEVPSPEPTKRVVPLDIFPADVIQNMDIHKTWSSVLPGTFGGGTVLINTKDIPKEDNYIKASIGLSVNESTGDEVIHNRDNSKAFPSVLVDLSDGFTELNDEIPGLIPGLTASERLKLDRAMVNYRRYNLDKTTLKPGSSLSTAFGQSFKTSSGIKYGFAGGLYYKSSAKHEEQLENDNRIIDGTASAYETKNSDKTSLKEKMGGLLSFGLEPSEDHKLKYTFLGLNEEEDQTKFSESFLPVEEESKTNTSYRYFETELFSHQLNGEHALIWSEGDFGGIDISWGYGTSVATRLEPGTVEYEYQDASSGADQLVLDDKSVSFLYSELEDTVDNYRMDFSLPFTLSGRDNKIDFGFFQLHKERELDNRRFKFEFSNTFEEDSRDIDDILTQDLADTASFSVKHSYREDDAYTAEQDLSAAYLSVLFSPINSLDVYLGARHESSTQELVAGIRPENQTTYSLETSDVLPFLSLTYRLNDEHQFRFGFSQSLTRPDFREFSPTRYKDPETDYIVRGNTELEYTEIVNLDLKYEWFPSFNEFVSFGIFYKDFTNPIETLSERPDDILEIGYENATAATSQGFEFGFRKNLDGLLGELNNYFIEGNYAWIDSTIELSDEDVSSRSLYSTNRPMQGQSPYVANLKFGYDNFFTRRSAMFVYNVFGERIDSLGVDGVPDIYEQPFHRLDFVVKWGLNDTYDEQVKRIGYDVSLKLKNLLDEEETYKQGDLIAKRIAEGRALSLGFSMKF